VFQRSAAVVAPRAETWRPGAAGVESVRQQARYDQSRTEEHPAAGESDDDEKEEYSAQDGRYLLYFLRVLSEYIVSCLWLIVMAIFPFLPYVIQFSPDVSR